MDRKFSKTNLACQSVKMCLSKSVNKNIKEAGAYSSDQSAIWNTVDQVSEQKGVKSKTACLNDVFDNYEKALKNFTDKAVYPDGATGLAVFSGKSLFRWKLLRIPIY